MPLSEKLQKVFNRTKFHLKIKQYNITAITQAWLRTKSVGYRKVKINLKKVLSFYMIV